MRVVLTILALAVSVTTAAAASGIGTSSKPINACQQAKATVVCGTQLAQRTCTTQCFGTGQYRQCYTTCY